MTLKKHVFPSQYQQGINGVLEWMVGRDFSSSITLSLIRQTRCANPDSESGVARIPA